MHLSLTFTQTERLTYTLQQRQELAHKCLMQCQEAISQIHEAIGLDSSSVASGVFQGVAALADDQIRDPAARQLLGQLLTLPANQSYMLQHVGKIVDAFQAGFLGFAARAVVDLLDRNSDGEILPPGDPSGTPVSRGILISALEAPYVLRAALEDNRKLLEDLRKSKEDLSGLIREISEKDSALRIGQQVQPQQKLLAGVLELAFRIKDSEQQPILQSFFKELDLMKGLEWQVSERIVKRFIARFQGLRACSAGYDYTDAMMNTISEFVMVSLGIVQPELFQSMRGEVDQLGVLFLDQNQDDCSNRGSSVVATMQKLSLSERGTFYWCRWAIPGAQLSTRTDDAIRNLMRNVIGQSKDDTLQAFAFDDFVNDLRQAKRELPREEALTRFGELLYERLRAEKFRGYLQDRCVRLWYPHIKQVLDLSRTDR